jgi:CheY-like chemotaxis protein/HPt (histidine-containing phosphotransfer) domain-containing protein
MAQNQGEPMRARLDNLEANSASPAQENGRVRDAHDGPAKRAELASRPLCVLLVEDNATNQMLAASLLKKAGHYVSTARNGIEALAAFASRAFDIVLMDIEMPEMDGFEATARIRAQEQPGGGHVPIVAMTAHDTKEDRERCLQAGMDGYLSKPLHSKELYQALASFAPAPTSAEPKRGALQPATGAQPTLAAGTQSELPPTAAPREVFDRATLLVRLGLRQDRLQTIVQTFLHESSDLMAGLSDAITCRDALSVQRSAHSLRGAAAIFGASSVVECVSALEALAQAGELAAATAAYARLEQEFEKLRSALIAALPPRPG